MPTKLARLRFALPGKLGLCSGALLHVFRTRRTTPSAPEVLAATRYHANHGCRIDEWIPEVMDCRVVETKERVTSGE